MPSEYPAVGMTTRTIEEVGALGMALPAYASKGVGVFEDYLRASGGTR